MRGIAGPPADPYPVSLATIETVWRARQDEVGALLASHGFVLIEDWAGGPLFRDRLGRTATLDDVAFKAEVDPGLRYALYQKWMDVSRLGS